VNKLYILYFYIFFLFYSVTCYAQRNPADCRLKIVFYNCENFFDIYDDPVKNDNEFLPQSKKNWTAERYQTKVNNISRVICAIDSINLPDIVGLCEIENGKTLADLIKNQNLSRGAYKAVHFESSDDRGIDVALLFDSSAAKVLSARPVPVSFSGVKLREILYAKTVVFNSDTLHIFVNHWKSRSGGIAETQSKRIMYASVLKKITDSLFLKNPNANIIIMGDLNDEPGDTSVFRELNAQGMVKNPQPQKLYNLFYDFYKAGQGSYYYGGDKKWNMMDQIILSGNLFSSQKNVLHYVPGSAEIFRRNWLLYQSPKSQMLPSKTYSGTMYHGGFSDHLPVTVSLVKKHK